MIYPTPKSILCLCATLLLLAGCAHQQEKKPVMPRMSNENIRLQKIESDAKPLLDQGEKYFQARNYAEARIAFQTMKNRFPSGRANMIASYRLATVYYYLGDYHAATKEFESFLQKYPNSELAFDVTYNLAASQFQLGSFDKSFQTLTRLKKPEIIVQGPKRADIVFQLMARSAEELKYYPAAILATATQMQLPRNENSRHALSQNVDEFLAGIASRSELEKLRLEVTEPTIRHKIAQRMQAITDVDTKVAMVEPTALATPTPPSSQSPVIPEPKDDYLDIGVVLPLSGKNATYGRRALDGILLATGIYEKQSKRPIRIMVEDTASSPVIADRVIDNLLHKHRVMTVIGPLQWKESVVVAEKCQRTGMPNISLSTREGISEKGDVLFQNGLSPRVQLEGLVKYAIHERHMKRFAVLAPNDTYGRDMEATFWNYVEKEGGKIVAYQSYPAGESDFQKVVQELTGIANPRHRKLEAQKLEEFQKAQKEKTGKETKARLQPIVDFDAIFVPDSSKVVASVAASLAYFDVTNVPLLGTSEWNGELLYERAGKYVEGAIFPGGINLTTHDMRQKEFIRLFSDAYGVAPDLLALQGFEAVELITVAVAKGATSRADIARELGGLRDFNSVLGTAYFDGQRLLRRNLPVYVLSAGGTVLEK